MITLPHILVLISICFSVFASSAYIRDTLKGITKPNRVTWFMWSLATLVGSTIAFFSGADPWVTSRVFVAGALPFVVFLSSFVNAQSYWKLTRFDVGCGVLSFLAFALWLISRQASVAILLSIAADVFASTPTLVKAWKNPETETGISYVLYSLSFVIIFPAIPIWNIENAGFQIYLIAINAIIAFLVYKKKFIHS